MALETWSVISSLCKDEEALKNLQCPYCANLLRNPVQPTCGHRLCQSCADKIIETSTPPICPLVDCEEEFTTEDGAHYFPDRFVRREIQGLEVNCKFQNEGCNWEGTYGDLPSHLNTCKYALLGMKLCPFQPLGCSNKSSMNDDELREHLRESEYDHLTVIVNYYRLLSEKVNKLQGRSLMRDNCVEADGADTGYETMDMPGYDRVPVSYYDQVEKDGSATSVVEKGTRGSPQSLAMKPLYRATLEVPNALSTSQLREMMDREMEDLREKVMSSTMERLQSKDEEIASLRTQITKLEKQIRSKNAELEDRDFRLSLIENSNHDGSMIWKIPQFSQRKADAENGKYTSIFSLPFYSGRYGYKMCLRLYIMGDGIGKGTHLSLFFVVMRGEFGNILHWPFTHKVTFKLINQAGGRDIVDTCPLLTLDELRHQWLKDRLHDFLWLQRVRRQEKSLECRTTAPLDVRWMEFQCLLLLTYGDVERNPGPLTSDELKKVADTVLSEDDYFDVFTSVATLCAKWHDLCLALGLPPSLVSSIKRDHTGDSNGCLREGLISWLQRSYNVDKRGLPTWRKLVEAVDHPAGGHNHALALKIAEQYKQLDVLPPKESSVAASTANQPSMPSDPKKCQAMSMAFASMYRSVSRLLQRTMEADELAEFLRCFCHPQSPRQLCVDQRLYEGASSTKDILKQLCPEYINPAELFVLEGIVDTFGSRQCKKLLRDFQAKFY